MPQYLKLHLDRPVPLWNQEKRIILKGNSEMLAMETETFSMPENIRAMSAKIHQKANDLIKTINDYFPLQLQKKIFPVFAANSFRHCCDICIDVGGLSKESTRVILSWSYADSEAFIPLRI